MARVFNFSAGPSMLPESVLREAAEEMLDYRGTGMSVMEMSHRSKAFDTIIKEAEQDLRDIMEIPDNYKVLFLQGGASQQFAAIPMNLMGAEKIYTHGEKEVLAQKDRMEHGIQVNDNTMAELANLCDYLKLDFSSYFKDYQLQRDSKFFTGNY